MDRSVYADTVRRYIEELTIDCFAVPCQIDGFVWAVLFEAYKMPPLVASDSKLIEYGRNVIYPRWGRIMTPTKVLPALHPFAKYKTDLRDIDTIQAQEWELVILATIGGEYRGHLKHDVDIVHPIYGRIEIKKGRGKIGENA